MSKLPHIAIIGNLNDEDIKFVNETLGNQASLYFYKTDTNIKQNCIEDSINTLITVNYDGCEKFKEMLKLDDYYKSKWLHFYDSKDITLEGIFFNYLNTQKIDKFPLISVYTYISDYNTILRSYESLKQQNYDNWEWIIGLDLSDNSDGLHELIDLTEIDPRIKIHSSINGMNISGEIKYNLAKLCHGEILIQLNCGDELVYNCMDIIIKAFASYPDADFLYADYSTEDIDQNSYYQCYKDKIINVIRVPNINPKSIRQNIGGIKVWKSSFYNKISGHNYLLSDIEDHELFIRSFLNGTAIKIPHLIYLSYKKSFNNDIKDLINTYYNNQITCRFRKLKIDDSYRLTPHQNPWQVNHLELESFKNYIYRPELVSIVIPTYKRTSGLKRAIDSILSQSYTNFEICIVGDKCPELDSFILKYKDVRIKWFNLQTNAKDSGATPRNYALKMIVSGKYVAYCDDDDYWLNDHLQLLMDLMNKDSELSYVFSSFMMGEYPIMVKEPKLYRITTSALLHKTELLEKYGYWSPFLYAHDWDLVSRWVIHGERYASTNKITMIYEVNPQHVNPEAIYNCYGDQKPLFKHNSLNEITIEEVVDIKQIPLAITTLTYNNRDTLLKTIRCLKPELSNTHHQIDWYILLQNCTNEYIESIKNQLVDIPSNVKVEMLVYKQNLGLSPANNILISKTKDYKYVLHLEDDWISLPLHLQPVKLSPNVSWIDICVEYMENNKDISTILLRSYNNEKEKWQYGWSRTIPYMCHVHKDNFNFEEKMKSVVPVIYKDIKFTEIPTFLFTFNPCIRRNEDYNKTVFPLPEFNDDQKDESHNQHWGWCEAVSMEKIRHLKAVWINEGIFGHYEDWINDLKF